MSYLEKLLPEFRNRAKIKRECWSLIKFVHIKNGKIVDEDGNHIDFSDEAFISNDWELYQEPIDWDYIIENSCLCWFWDDENDKNFIATLEAFEIDICVTSFKSKNGAVWHNCRPVRKDEVNFYEDAEDD